MKTYKVQCTVCGYAFNINVQQAEEFVTRESVKARSHSTRETFECMKCRARMRIRLKRLNHALG